MASRGVDGLPYDQLLKVNVHPEYWPMGLLVTIETKTCMQDHMVHASDWVGRALEGIDSTLRWPCVATPRQCAHLHSEPCLYSRLE